MVRVWKINCMEADYPGLWRQWFQNQCVAVGWPPGSGFRLHGPSKGRRGWNKTRRVLVEITEGDSVIVQLRNHRVGRIGQVVSKKVEDDQWDPLVPRSRGLRHGEMGRRILVRWDLASGPEDKDQVVQLPEGCRFSTAELRPTACRVRSLTSRRLLAAVKDPANWVGLLGHFGYERALSEYISAYPHRLEDGLAPYPSLKVRERVFRDGTRSDVLLMDRSGAPVVVECKQGTPSVEDVQQLRHYMQRLQEETSRRPRGILVHGGARRLPADVRPSVSGRRDVGVVRYLLDVDFAPRASGSARTSSVYSPTSGERGRWAAIKPHSTVNQ